MYVYEVDNPNPLICRSFSLYVRPRSFYLDFLPALYREVDFIQRLIALFEQAFDPYVQAIDALWAYLDPLTAPQLLLPFLAHWVAWEIEPNWNLERQRHLIRHAMTIYRWHGTRQGLRFYLHLYTGLPIDEDLPEAQKHISIQEVFEGGFQYGACILGQDSVLGGGRPYHFGVCLRPQRSDLIDETLVRSIIDRAKPAFCTYDLEIAPIDAGTEGGGTE